MGQWKKYHWLTRESMGQWYFCESHWLTPHKEKDVFFSKNIINPLTHDSRVSQWYFLWYKKYHWLTKTSFSSWGVSQKIIDPLTHASRRKIYKNIKKNHWLAPRRHTLCISHTHTHTHTHTYSERHTNTHTHTHTYTRAQTRTYRVATKRKMPHLFWLFSAKEPYI